MIQVLFYVLLWIWDSYIATLLSATFMTIAFFILVVSLIAELLERSKVPKIYFWGMAISVFTPLFTAILFLFLNGGEMEWLK